MSTTSPQPRPAIGAAQLALLQHLVQQQLDRYDQILKPIACLADTQDPLRAEWQAFFTMQVWLGLAAGRQLGRLCPASPSAADEPLLRRHFGARYELLQLVVATESMSVSEAVYWATQIPTLQSEHYQRLCQILRAERQQLAVLEARSTTAGATGSAGGMSAADALLPVKWAAVARGMVQ